MRFHLISYATAKYRHRQWLLAASARANGVVHTVTSWNPTRLNASGFSRLAPEISLSERGSGFWAWKPYVIRQALESSADGDIVFYCDVGRKYPYILLDTPLDPFVDWMDTHGQDILPGVLIPWNGQMEVWTKADAFKLTEMDRPDVRSATPIQASFSFWRSTPATKDFVNEWLSLCIQRRLVSDDPSQCVPSESPVFRGHRHDQSLLTLCCLRHGIKGIDVGTNEPSYNERDPGSIARTVFSGASKSRALGKLIRFAAMPIQSIEQLTRSRMTFGRKYE